MQQSRSNSTDKKPNTSKPSLALTRPALAVTLFTLLAAGPIRADDGHDHGASDQQPLPPRPQATGETRADARKGLVVADQDRQVVAYPADFFRVYRPTAALDMVNQLPGFQLSDGMELRGFGGAAGNLLINDRRPSAKQDPPSEILARIPAGYVDQIEVIRGQVRGIDMRGHSVVANVILREDIPASVRWEAFLWKNNLLDMIMPGGEVSISNDWGNIDYNAGFQGNHHGHSEEGTRNSFTSDGSLTEDRVDKSINKHLTMSGNLNASTWWGETLLQLNTELGLDNVTDDLEIVRDPIPLGDPFQEIITEDRERYNFEVGLNAERTLRRDLIGNAIFLYSQNEQDEINTQSVFTPGGVRTLRRQADVNTLESETIGRVELAWAGWENHTLQANFEGAWNVLDNELLQTDDTGAGPVLVDVPGANARVEESRGDFLLQDSWTAGEFLVDYGLGLEVSTISTSGDSEQERSFTFVKPQALVTWAPSQQQQTRFRLAREAAQLDLLDFVTATAFRDDDLALGNPDLKPETTWVSELSHEQRFGRLGVLSLRAFHHWITDVQDLLPITDEFEAPGNIGDGRRWGLQLEGTLPLAWLGLTGARLDVRSRWQDSSVTDPVTGEDRVLSGESGLSGQVRWDDQEDVEFRAEVGFRQDFQQARWAWGWDVATRSERPLYKVNELDIYDEGMDVGVFVETTRWLGMKVRVAATNLFNTERLRTRTLYEGLRGLSEVERVEVTDYARGRQVELVLSGNF